MSQPFTAGVASVNPSQPSQVWITSSRFESSGRGFGGAPRLTSMTVGLFDGTVSLVSASYVERSNYPDPAVTRSLAFQATSATTRVDFYFIYDDALYDGRYFALVDNVSRHPVGIGGAGTCISGSFAGRGRFDRWVTLSTRSLRTTRALRKRRPQYRCPS